jgi:hypothetical protein
VTISYLGLSISNYRNRQYRESAATDITLDNNSCSPGEHKIAIFKNWINRLEKLSLNGTNKDKELNTIINIVENNV